MKKILLVCVFATFLIATTLAGPSLEFTTGAAGTFSWTVTESGGVYTMSFTNIEVDTTDPALDWVQYDIIDLPSMTITNIDKNPLGFIVADMVPVADEPLTIIANTPGPEGVLAGDTVMTADVSSGGILTMGKNWMAYSQELDDLDITDYVSNYSVVIDGFAAAETANLFLDLSFTGQSASSLYIMLDQNLTDPISGTLSGQISVGSQTVIQTPAPGAILLGGIGVVLVGWLRRRRTL